MTFIVNKHNFNLTECSNSKSIGILHCNVHTLSANYNDFIHTLIEQYQPQGLQINFQEKITSGKLVCAASLFLKKQFNDKSVNSTPYKKRKLTDISDISPSSFTLTSETSVSFLFLYGVEFTYLSLD